MPRLTGALPGLIGGSLGLGSLVYSVYLVLSGWPLMSQTLKFYVLILPSLAATISLLALAGCAWILVARLYRRVAGVQTADEYGFLDEKVWGMAGLIVWPLMALALYAALQQVLG